MKHHNRQHQHPNDARYRAAILRGAVAGAVHALIAWLLEH